MFNRGWRDRFNIEEFGAVNDEFERKPVANRDLLSVSIWSCSSIRRFSNLTKVKNKELENLLSI